MEELAITKRIIESQKLGDSGKINNFFLKQKLNCEKAIRDLRRNKTTFQNIFEDKVCDFKDKIEDAKIQLRSDYEAIKVEDVNTNADILRFQEIYWNKIYKSKSELKRLENQLNILSNEHTLQIEEIDEQIDLYQENIAAIVK